MPRAEAGTPKALANKMKSKGLQRLRWYCQVCERQMRDENGFKCHTQSEGHVRQMLLISGNPNRAINDYSKQFERDFIQLLRTTHGTKPIQVNQFYQQYIANKEHVHMNATRWPSLSEFAKYLGREGICRVEETEKGLHVAWIDNSPEALRRQDAIRKQERMDKGDEAREQRLIEEQVKRAKENAQKEDEMESRKLLERSDGDKITLNFGTAKTATSIPPSPPSASRNEGSGEQAISMSDVAVESEPMPPRDPSSTTPLTATSGVKLSMGSIQAKPKNVFATSKNPLAPGKTAPIPQPKKMSEAERIMKEEIERKRSTEAKGFDNVNRKRQKIG